MYDPKVGRWLSQDPLGFSTGDSDLYRYVGNQPTDRTDPSGLVGIFFDGTLETAKTNSIIRRIFAFYHRNEPNSEIYEFTYLGGSRFGGIGELIHDINSATPTMPHSPVPSERRQAEQEFDDQVEAAFQFIMQKRAKDEPVDIFGYSRGAIAAVYLARKLKGKSIEVRYMGLIDPSVTYSGKQVPTIPDNVRHVRIVYALGQCAGSLTEFASDYLIVSNCRLRADDPNKTRIDAEEVHRFGHFQAGRDQLSGAYLWPFAIEGLPLGKNPFNPPELQELRR